MHLSKRSVAFFFVAIPIGLLAGIRMAAGQNSPGCSEISGVVSDSSGSRVARARVSVGNGSSTVTRTTDDQGKFTFASVRGRSGSIVVRAQGFAPLVRTFSTGDPDLAHLDLVLTPATVSSEITVTATRTPERLSDTAADVVILNSQDLASTAAQTLDQTLRNVPGFKLFRRSSSLVANPTSQGVTLRGVGGTAASRALVLEDGIPLNDPYGAWVYWDRLPGEVVTGVEVARGGASNLYGSKAMGGVVNILTRRPVSTNLGLETSYGNQNTPDLSLNANLRVGNWGIGFAGEDFHTDGWVLVPEGVRGPIDSRAGVDYRSGILMLDRRLNAQARLFATASYLGEFRHNGKISEQNATHLRQLSGGGDWQSDALGAFAIRAWGGPQLLDQNFFAVGANRASERLTDVQRVPAQQLGGSVQWSRPLGLAADASGRCRGEPSSGRQQ